MYTKNRVKVQAVGVDQATPFTLGDPVDSFQSFPSGVVNYTALTQSGKWEVGTGTVTGLILVRDDVQENYLGTTAAIDFTGETLQVAETITANLLTTNQTKLDALSDPALLVVKPPSTGILSGGKLTSPLGVSTFNVEAGQGSIVDNYTDPNTPTYTEFSWNEVVGVDITSIVNTLSVGTVHVFMDYVASVPTVVLTIGTLNLPEHRDKIYLGRVYVHLGLIRDIANSPNVVKQGSSDTTDLFRNSNFLSNYKVTPAGLGGLELDISSITANFTGINWHDTDHKNPNFLTISPASNITLRQMAQDGSVSSFGVPTIPLLWDDGVGTPALPTDMGTINRLFVLGLSSGNRRFILQLGQTLYTDLNQARKHIISDTFVNPTEVDSLELLAYIGISEGATDFTDINKAWIISADSLELTSSPALLDTTINVDSPLASSGAGTLFLSNSSYVVDMDASSGNSTIVLPSVIGIPDGKLVKITRIDTNFANNGFVKADGAELIWDTNIISIIPGETFDLRKSGIRWLVV